MITKWEIEKYDTILWLDEKINDILKYPNMYGTCKETIEFQIISCLEFKYVLLHGSKNPRFILDCYTKEILNIYPNSNTYLFNLALDNDDFLKKLKYIIEQTIKTADIQTSLESKK